MIIYLQMIESDEDKSKLEQLYIMYKGLMFHVAMKILKNEFDAEDAVHQAFLSLIENLKKNIGCQMSKNQSLYRYYYRTESNRYHSQPIKTGRYGILGEYLWHRNPIAW